MSETESGADPSPVKPSSVLLRIVRGPLPVWLAFVAVHLWLGLINLHGPGLPLGDVTIVYKFWMDQALAGHLWVGIDTAWVYPILALIPMLISSAFGPDLFASTWLTLVMVLNAIAFGFLTGWGRGRVSLTPAWWWVGFLALLGPIALGRIDSITVPIALVGVLLVARRPTVAAVLLTVATWIKVWPAALIAAAFIALRERLAILAAAILTCVAVLLVALLLGAGPNVLSFITQQTGRGLQVEAPVSTIWMWLAYFAVPGAHVNYDQEILTYQVYGPGAEVAAALMTPILGLAVLIVVVLGIRAVRAGARPVELLAPLSLALVTVLIAVNKVGSPQFVSWLAVPILLGIVTSALGRGRSFQTPAALVLAIAGLTQLIYPYLYSSLLSLDPALLIVLTGRNVLYFVLIGWAIHSIATQRRTVEGEPSDERVGTWPFTAAQPQRQSVPID